MPLGFPETVATTSRPAEVLRFCGVEPGMRVLDPMAGTGYSTEILAALVGPEGRMTSHNSPFVLDRFARRLWNERLARPELGNVEKLEAAPEEITVTSPVDVVLLVRFCHDFYWMEVDREAFNARVLAALEPGGIFCVVDHHAEKDSGGTRRPDAPSRRCDHGATRDRARRIRARRCVRPPARSGGRSHVEHLRRRRGAPRPDGPFRLPLSQATTIAP